MRRFIATAVVVSALVTGVALPAQATVRNGKVACDVLSVPRYDVVKYAFYNNYSYSVVVHGVTRLT
jgi:hypothetical protein